MEKGVVMGSIEQRFYAGGEHVVDKWLHYLPIYDRFFLPFRGQPVRMLEIGVGGGGSLDMWRDFFGPDATIFGIDINPKCSGRVNPPNQVRIGSQADATFLDEVLAELGRPDIVLDDGSHIGSHQIASFRHLFPQLPPGGLYLIEDLHTSYWDRFEGGYGKANTGIGLVRSLIDDQHGWHHDHPANYVPAAEIGGIHMFDSIVVIEKADRVRPESRRIGG